MMASSSPKAVNVGLCGGGIGGLAAAITLARGGCQVTVLEAAAELGEIGAGIQMTPNCSRLLLRWGVAKIIGKNLVEPQSARMRTKDGEVVDYVELVPSTREYLGFPVSSQFASFWGLEQARCSCFPLTTSVYGQVLELFISNEHQSGGQYIDTTSIRDSQRQPDASA